MIPTKGRPKLQVPSKEEPKRPKGVPKNGRIKKGEPKKGDPYLKGEPQEGKIFGRGKAISTFQPQGHFPTHHPQKKIPHVI